MEQAGHEGAPPGAGTGGALADPQRFTTRRMPRGLPDGTVADVRSAGTDEVDEGSSLVRQLSRHGPEYDALLQKGIPRRMLRRAWVVAAGDAVAAMEFIRTNFDADESFWNIPDNLSDPTSSPSESVPPMRVERLAVPPEHHPAGRCRTPGQKLANSLARPEMVDAMGLSESDVAWLLALVSHSVPTDDTQLKRAMSTEPHVPVRTSVQRSVRHTTDVPRPKGTGSGRSAIELLKRAWQSDVVAPADLGLEPEPDLEPELELEEELSERNPHIERERDTQQWWKSACLGDECEVNVGGFAGSLLAHFDRAFGITVTEDGRKLMVRQEQLARVPETMYENMYGFGVPIFTDRVQAAPAPGTMNGDEVPIFTDRIQAALLSRFGRRGRRSSPHNLFGGDSDEDSDERPSLKSVKDTSPARRALRAKYEKMKVYDLQRYLQAEGADR